VDVNAAARAGAAAMAVLVAEVDLHADDAVAQPPQGEVQAALQMGLPGLVQIDPLTPDVDLHDASPSAAGRIGTSREVSLSESVRYRRAAGKKQAYNPLPAAPALRSRTREKRMSTQTQVIHFYSTQGEHGCFSNFSRHAIHLKGKRWPTSEHYFQAQKFAGTQHEEEVRCCKTPRAAADMGRSRKLPLRRDWESVKDQVMREAVLTKFTQHEDLRAVLLGTGDALLVEHTANDSYWGDGGDGSGRNRLGQILMSVREELRGQSGSAGEQGAEESSS
jgi:ribA/ribD-fused uncharacterized protein